MTNVFAKRVFTGLAAMVLAGTLSACGGFSLLGPSGPPPNVYDLSPKSTFDADLPTVDWQLVVEEPVASRALDTDRIMVRRTPFEIGYISGARWSDRAPRMIQTRLVESFENTHHIVAVGRQTIGLRGDYNLKSELREFQAEYFDGEGGSSVLVRINFKIIEMPSANIIASTTLSRRQTLESENVSSIIVAFDDALGWVMKRGVQWSLRTIEGYRTENEVELGLFESRAHTSDMLNRVSGRVEPAAPLVREPEDQGPEGVTPASVSD